MLPLTASSSPVTARICAATAWRNASRLRNQEVANRPSSRTPNSAAIGMPRRFIPWAIGNDISGRVRVVFKLKAGRASPPADFGNLLGFLDAFKAVLALRRGQKGQLLASLTHCEDFA